MAGRPHKWLNRVWWASQLCACLPRTYTLPRMCCTTLAGKKAGILVWVQQYTNDQLWGW